MRPLQLQCSCNPFSRTTSEEQTFNMLSIYSRCQLRRLGQVRTIQVGRFVGQNVILTRSRPTLLPKSTTLATRGACRFHALR